MVAQPLTNVRGDPYVQPVPPAPTGSSVTIGGRDYPSSIDTGYLSSLDHEFERRMLTAIAAAEAATSSQVQVNSAFRTRDEQAQAYTNYLFKPWTDPATGKSYTPEHKTSLAAYPGSSYHEQGQAVDIQPGPALDWLHKHAGDYGLEFLGTPGNNYANDPVHMQLARGSQAPAVPPPTPGVWQNLPPEVLASLGLQGGNQGQPNTQVAQADTSPVVAASAPPPPPQQDLAYSVTDSPHQKFSMAENANIPRGPYGAEAVVAALLTGDPTKIADAAKAFQDGATAQVTASIPKGPFGIPNLTAIGPAIDAAKAQVKDYFSKTLPTQAPGAVRQFQNMLNANPDLMKLIPADQLPMLKDAFASLPTLGMNGQALPVPQLRPGEAPSSTASTAPAKWWNGPSAAPDAALGSTSPYDQSDEWWKDYEGPNAPPVAPPGGSQLPFGLGDNLDVRANPGTGDAAAKPYQAPAANAAGLAQLLGRSAQAPATDTATNDHPGPDFSTGFEAPITMASEKSPQQMAAEQQAARDQFNQDEWWKPYQGPTGITSQADAGTLVPKGNRDFGSELIPPTPDYGTLSPADQVAFRGLSGIPGLSADAGLDNTARKYWSPPPPVVPAMADAAHLNPNQLRGLEGPVGPGKPTQPLIDPNAYDPLADASIYNKQLPQPVVAASAPVSDPAVVKLQQQLAAAGFNPGKADGLFGPKTQAALDAYKASLAQPAAPAPGLAPRPEPALSPQQAFQEQAGPAPQNVNWDATLAKDNYAQPGTENTYVLNDLDTTPGQTDSYLNYPDFSWG